jgi:hypothetical protein
LGIVIGRIFNTLTYFFRRNLTMKRLIFSTTLLIFSILVLALPLSEANGSEYSKYKRRDVTSDTLLQNLQIGIPYANVLGVGFSFNFIEINSGINFGDLGPQAQRARLLEYKISERCTVEILAGAPSRGRVRSGERYGIRDIAFLSSYPRSYNGVEQEMVMKLSNFYHRPGRMTVRCLGLDKNSTVADFEQAIENNALVR